MPERIDKLQPDRTIQLRGFDHLGASAAIHHATPTGFQVSGNFRDPADFAVLILYDADNFYEHPRLKYLPDTDFDGLTLQFDVAYDTGLMPLDCRKYPTIDWPYLDVTRADNTSTRIRLSDYATIVAGSNSPAQGEFQILGDNLDAFDRLTLWYQNLAFDYIVPGKLRTEFPFYAAGPGAIHSLNIAGTLYNYTEAPDVSSADIASRLINLAAADPNVTVSAGSQAHIVKVERKLDTGAAITVSATGSAPETLYQVQATTVANALRDLINSTNYTAAATPFALHATTAGATLRITTVESGYDANFITLYAISKNARLTVAQPVVPLTGGTSNATLRVTLDFAARGIPQIRTMWLTFAPRLAAGQAYLSSEWNATFSNWTLTGPDAKRRLQVAAPASVRVNSSENLCTYNPDKAWVNEEGFFSENFAKGCSVIGATVTIKYHCAYPHDLWVGTALYAGRGTAGVTVDGVAKPDLTTHLTGVEPPVITRRRIATGLTPGDHTVLLTVKDAKPFYFDFLEAVVPGDVPDSLPARPNISPALDYSTDHTYKLPPGRILWALDKLGFRGAVNEYIGVFWWNQRQRSGGSFPYATVTFSGQFQPGDGIFMDLSGLPCRKAVLANETPEQIARHFAYLINADFVGVWASASGATLTITARSPEDAYRDYILTARVENVAGSTGTLVANDQLRTGSSGTWVVDPSQSPPLNRGARDWHADLYAQAKQRNLDAITACSMELVFPPAGFAACYKGGAEVVTSVGFGNMSSAHCGFNSATLAYQKEVYKYLAQLMAAANLTPRLQFGEFSWWYFTNGASMAYYDADTEAAALTALGRPLHVFTSPDDDPAQHQADAIFLRNRLRDYVAALRTFIAAAVPGAKFEVLFPYDVNHPTPAGVHNLGGRLNRFVNLPVEWERKETSGLDSFKLEALDFGAWSRNLDLVYKSIQFPLQLGWPKDSVTCMVPVFRGGYPWEKEVSRAQQLGVAAVHLWAFDHVCLYSWPVQAGMIGRASMQG